MKILQMDGNPRIRFNQSVGENYVYTPVFSDGIDKIEQGEIPETVIVGDGLAVKIDFSDKEWEELRGYSKYCHMALIEFMKKRIEREKWPRFIVYTTGNPLVCKFDVEEISKEELKDIYEKSGIRFLNKKRHQDFKEGYEVIKAVNERPKGGEDR